MPPTIHPSKTTQVANVLENDNVTIECHADGFPSPNVSWVKVSGNPLPAPWDRFAYRVRAFVFSVNVPGSEKNYISSRRGPNKLNDERFLRHS